jgi:voltage-gated potassium channel
MRGDRDVDDKAAHHLVDSRPARRRWRVFIALLRRVAIPLFALVGVFAVGTLGYWIIGRTMGRDWSLLDCAFMASISLSTVGYGDTLGVTDTVVGKIYTMGLIVTGMGATVYSVSALTAFIVEGYLGTLFREARLEQEIERLEQHTIVCGAGTTGIHVIDEHVAQGAPLLVIENDETKIASLLEKHPRVLHLVGDATSEEVLARAGVARARALVAVLSADKDNMYLVVSAHFMNPKLRIVARCADHEAVGKFAAAGATDVVSPAYIGGLRMASQVLRPHIVDFLDDMLRSNDGARVSESFVSERSSVAGVSIRDAHIRDRVGLDIVAIKRPGTREFTYSPEESVILEPGTLVVSIGPIELVRRLEALLAGK